MVSHRVLLVVAGCSCGARDDDSPNLASPAARRLAHLEEHLEGTPCPTFAAGSDIRIGEFSYRLERPSIHQPETRSPWITSAEERSALAGAAVLVVPFSIVNHGASQHTPPFSVTLVTRDGAVHQGWPDNEKVWARANHRLVVHELVRLPPQVVAFSGFVFDVDPDQLDDAVMYFQQASYERDRTGAHRSVRLHAVADLASADRGEAIRGN